MASPQEHPSPRTPSGSTSASSDSESDMISIALMQKLFTAQLKQQREAMAQDFQAQLDVLKQQVQQLQDAPPPKKAPPTKSDPPPEETKQAPLRFNGRLPDIAKLTGPVTEQDINAFFNRLQLVVRMQESFNPIPAEVQGVLATLNIDDTVTEQALAAFMSDNPQATMEQQRRYLATAVSGGGRTLQHASRAFKGYNRAKHPNVNALVYVGGWDKLRRELNAAVGDSEWDHTGRGYAGAEILFDSLTHAEQVAVSHPGHSYVQLGERSADKDYVSQILFLLQEHEDSKSTLRHASAP